MSRAGTPRRVDWGHLQYFLVVAEGGSIQKAAQRLGVNHSTVLRRIAHLEGDLGCRLFDRLPGGYALTAAGNNLAEHLAGLSEQMDGAERRLRGLDETLVGPVRITSSDIVVEGLLMPLLAGFRRRHPRVQLQLVTDYAFASLGPSEADVAVRGADDVPASLIARPVGHVETVLCASRAYVRAHPAHQPFERHRWVILDESLAFTSFDRWFREHVPPDRVVMRVDSLVDVAEAVAQGLGVGFLPRPLIATRPELVPLGEPEPALRRPIWVLMHPHVQQTARVKALFEFLAGALAAHAQLTHT